MGKAQRKQTRQTMAELADRHELYEESVQDVEVEVDFLLDTFSELRGRDPQIFREDFCGTASACCEWVRRGSDRRAVGVDLDPEVLAWGRQNRLSHLTHDERERVTLIQDDVRTASTGVVDLIGAFNFSYFIFDTRDEMRRYFERCRECLADDGILFLDAFGGSETMDVVKEETEHDEFTYVWHQAEYHPVTGYMKCHIHFKFPDGSKMKKAFSYEWRLWTLPEIRELLFEAGFSTATVYWEGEDEDGEGNGEFTPESEGDPDPAWIVYIVAER